MIMMCSCIRIPEEKWKQGLYTKGMFLHDIQSTVDVFFNLDLDIRPLSLNLKIHCNVSIATVAAY